MEKEYSNITYSLYICRNPRVRKINQVWDLELKQISEEKIRGLAKAYKFRKGRIEKLINHTSKGFTYVRKKEYEIVKSFHPKPVETMSVSDDRQPLNQRFKILNKQKDDQQNEQTK